MDDMNFDIELSQEVVNSQRQKNQSKDNSSDKKNIIS